jgi:UDP-3-O-[3-hydroxymyristoyl] glucosamine N-acyltransferase
MLAFLEDRKFLRLLRRTPEISCVITTRELSRELRDIPGLAIAQNPRRVFFDFHNHLAQHTEYYWSDFPTKVAKTAKIHPRACIAEKNVRIGPGTVVEANATIAERCIIGASVVIRAGSVVGLIGFQTSRFDDRMVDMVHAGGVRLHDHVEVMANAVIARAVFREYTAIEEYCRIGNVAFVSHAVKIGPRSLIGHGAVVNGNVRIGADVWIGPGATLVHSIEIGDGAQVSLGSAVMRTVRAGQRVTSNVAIDHRRYLRHVASLAR